MKYKCDVKIMAVKPRRKMVLKMCEQLGLSEEECVIYDDRPSGGGTLYTCRKCWESPVADGVTHRVVLQDDLELCNDFIATINKIINVNPEFIFTLFCPRVRYSHAVDDSPYVIIKGWNTWGQGIVMPVSYVKPMFEFADRELGADFPYDDGIYAWWAKRERIWIATTIPSTIQHLCPSDSTLGYNNKNKVSKVWRGKDLSDVNWESKKIAFSPSMPISVSLDEQKAKLEKLKSKPVFTIFRDNNGNKFEN